MAQVEIQAGPHRFISLIGRDGRREDGAPPWTFSGGKIELSESPEDLTKINAAALAVVRGRGKP